MRFAFLIGFVLAACTTPPPRPVHDLAVTDVVVVDTASGTLAPSTTVLVDDGRIVALQKSDAPVAAREVVSGAGRYLMPALADMHVHLREPSHLPLYVAHGVTLVRDMWGSEERLQMRAAAASNPQHPTIVAGSPGVDGVPPTFPGEPSVGSPEEARALVRELAQAGYDFIKVYDRLDSAPLAAVLDEAEQHGLPVAGHAPFAVPIEETLASSMVSLEHGQLYMFEYLSPEIPIPEGPIRPEVVFPAVMPYVGRAIAEGRLDSVFVPEARLDFARRVAASGVWTTPTFTALINANTPSTERDEWFSRPEVQALDEATLKRWGPENFRFGMMNDQMLGVLRTLGRQLMPFIAELDREGGRILVGTDAPEAFIIPGVSIHEELAYLVEAGLTPARAIRAATADAAEFLGRSDWGRIEVGFEADFILLEANPLEDISRTRAIIGVSNDGAWMPHPTQR